MSAIEIGVIERGGAPDRRVKWDKSTGEVWVQYYPRKIFGGSWEWRTSRMRAKTVDQAYEIAQAILES